MGESVRGFFAFRRFSDWVLTGASAGVLALAFISYGELKEWRRTEESKVAKVEAQTESVIAAITEVKISVNKFSSESESNRLIMSTQTDYLKKISENVVGIKEIRSLEMKLRELEDKFSDKTTNYKQMAWKVR